MTFVRVRGQEGDESAYVCRSTCLTKGRAKKQAFRDWWLVKNQGACGYVPAWGIMTFPKSFVGKKIRFRVEVAEDLV